MSKGEEKIASLLKKSKYKFEREKRFGDLKRGAYRFDFYVNKTVFCKDAPDGKDSNIICIFLNFTTPAQSSKVHKKEIDEKLATVLRITYQFT